MNKQAMIADLSQRIDDIKKAVNDGRLSPAEAMPDLDRCLVQLVSLLDRSEN